MNDSKAKAYTARFAKVLYYIETHLNEPLSVAQLSRVANFSKFHFHRQFAEYSGVSVARYILLRRLRHATYRLVFNSPTRIIDIALDAGFENPESFARGFDITARTPVLVKAPSIRYIATGYRKVGRNCAIFRSISTI